MKKATAAKGSSINEKPEDLLAVLKKDGLAESNNVSIEFRSGKLSIDGKEQSEDVVKKYQQFLGEKDADISLKLSDEKK